MKKIGILYNPLASAAVALAGEIAEFLKSKGVGVWVGSVREEEQARAQLDGTELLISVGGDGTILRSSHVVVPGEIPILGVNLGRLGFMTELGPGEVLRRLPALLDGKGWIDERAMLELGILPPGENPGSESSYYALNDVFVGRGSIARLVYVEARINGQVLTGYRADGVLVATATGSTGYSLAAGGPILHTQAREFVLLPLMSHLGSSYPLVLPQDSAVRLRLSTSHEAVVMVDGHINIPISTGTVVGVRLSLMKVRFLRIRPRESFYSTLERKLKGRRQGESGKSKGK